MSANRMKQSKIKKCVYNIEHFKYIQEIENPERRTLYVFLIASNTTNPIMLFFIPASYRFTNFFIKQQEQFPLCSYVIVQPFCQNSRQMAKKIIMFPLMHNVCIKKSYPVHKVVPHTYRLPRPKLFPYSIKSASDQSDVPHQQD